MITLYNEIDEKLKLISVFEFNDADMGESSISATVSFDKEQDFHPDWYVIYNGERFRLGARKPTGKKDTSSLSTTYTLVFKSEREDLKRYTFMDFVELGTGNPQPSSYNVSLYATLSEFVDRFNTNLRYYMGSRWQMVLPADYVEDGNAISVAFDNASLWDVLIKVYEIFGVRWVIRSAGDILQIQVGFQEVEIEHVFEYGKGNGLVSVERNNALERIITRLRGRGSERNLPADYFHTGDPDTNSFLQATYYRNLMPKSYRDYIRGYNAGSGTGSWAYNQGVADKKQGKAISPVDYALSDKEDLWGISYGAIEPNEKIFPTLQGATRDGVRLDEVLAVEKVLVDGVKEPQNTIAIGIDAAGQESSSGKCGNSPKNNYLEDCRGGIEFTIFTDRFQVTNPINTAQIRITMSPSYIGDDGLPVPVEFGATSTVRGSAELQLVDFANSITGEVIRTQTISDTDSYLWELDDIPSGDYRFKANVVWSANIQRAEYDPTASDVVVNVDTRLTGATVKEYARATDKGEWKETFDIEIRDVWGIARNADESDEDYTYRVWEPRAVSEDMTVMFSDGLLAGEDYEFRIVGFSSDSDNLYQVITTAIKPTSDGGWKLTLQKSEAELEASNTYLPNTQQNAKPGDHFFFINISMPYDPYVYDAEARLNAYLEEQLAMKDEEFPSFTITPSKIFCSSFGEVDKIKAGAKIRVRNVALIGDSYISLYIQSLTKRYNANSLNPEWNLTLSDLVVASGNPVEVLEGQVNVLTQRVYSNRSAVQEAVRSLSSTFVRKDGIADVSYSPTEFKKNIKLGEGIADKGFRAGDIQGQGFGVYTDDDGNRVIEADVLVGRIGARFNEVVINQVSYSAGKQVFSAAGMVVSRVEDAGTSWRCYFDTKNGTVRNYFAVNDGAFSQRFTDAGIRQYWARVTAIGADYIDISKTDRMQGSFDPVVGDNIAQLGNSVDKSRQAALMIDETHDGGGLVTWYDDITDFTLSNKDSVNIGRVGGKTWLQVYGAGYIGDREQTQYVRYENGVLQIRGRLEVGTKLSDGRDLEQAINEATPEGYEEFVESVTDDIDDIKVSVDGVEKSIEDIQKELDGAIETWFYEGVPTLANAPASDWTTDELKNVHLGDLYYDGVTGKAYRFQMDGSIYVWREITDTDIQAALEAASKAQDTADKKRRIFIVQPKPPYDEGDLWAGGKSEPLRRCIVARSSGSFDAEDWDYADSTQEQIAGYEYLKRALGESTTVEGGLIQSSLLMLGYTENGVFNVMSGTNGLYDATKKGGGIAAWYGGPMADIEADNTLVKYAQSLFRFDGSGYLAGGNITWDKDGAGSVAGGDLSWDKDGVITLGGAIKISGDVDATLGSILEYVNELRKLWSYDEENKAVHTTLNLIVDGGGAFGKGSGGGGDVPSGGGIDETQLWDILGASGTQTIHSSHIPDLSGKYLSVSGGTINGGIGALSIKRNSSNSASIIKFENSDRVMGYLGISNSNLPIWYNKDLTDFGYLIHSGNIGSYNAGSATKLQDNTAFTAWGQTFFQNGVPKNVNGPLYDVNGKEFLYASGDLVRIGSGTTGAGQNTFLDGNNIYLRYGTSYGIGLFLNSYGNILIGTTTDNGYKLDVNGTLNATTIYQNGTAIGSLAFKSSLIASDIPSLDWSKITSGKPTTLSGYGITNALPLSGGKLNGTTQTPLTINTSSKVEVGVGYTMGDVSKAWIGYNPNSGVILYNYACGKVLGLTDDGTPHYNGKTLYHTGNFNPANYLPLSGGAINGNLDINTTSGTTMRYLRMWYNAASRQNRGMLWIDENNMHLSHYSPTDGINNELVFGRGGLSYNNNILIHSGNIGSYNAGSADYLKKSYGEENVNYAKGSGVKMIFTTASDKNAPIYTSGLSVITDHCGWQMVSYAISSVLPNPYYRAMDSDGSYTMDWRQLAFLDDNVASATKLQTARTIWGQSFDGSGDVSGDLGLSSSGIYWVNDITNYSIKPASNYEIIYKGYRGHSFMTAGGERLKILNNGNILIGTPTDNSAKLQVSGASGNGLPILLVNSSTDETWNYMASFLAPNTSVNNGVSIILGHSYDSKKAGLLTYRVTNSSNYLSIHHYAVDNILNIYDSGNVLIGATSDNGCKFQVNGTTPSYFYNSKTRYSLVVDGGLASKIITFGGWNNNEKAQVGYTDDSGFSIFNYQSYRNSDGVKITAVGITDTGIFYVANSGNPGPDSAYLKVEITQTTVTGNLTVTGGGAFGSDIRYKDITSYRQLDLETIVNAPLFTFKWTDREDKEQHLGTSAQYWLGTQAKDAVNITNPKFYHLDYGALAVGIGISVAREVKGVKTEVQILREKVGQLEQELAQYRRA